MEINHLIGWVCSFLAGSLPRLVCLLVFVLDAEFPTSGFREVFATARQRRPSSGNRRGGCVPEWNHYDHRQKNKSHGSFHREVSSFSDSEVSFFRRRSSFLVSDLPQ